MNDRLYRSRDDRVLGGVCAGLADRLDLDPSLVRIGWVVLTVFTGGLLLLLYIVMLIVVPEEPAAGGSAVPAQEPGAISGWTPPASGTGWTPPAGARPGDPAAGWGPAATGAAVASATGEATPGAGADALGSAAPEETGPAGAPSEATAPGTAATPGWIPPSASTPYPDTRAARRAERRAARAERRQNADPIAGLVFGAILVLLGVYFLLQLYVPSLDLGRFWPVIIIGIGVLLIVRAVSRPRPEG